MAFFEIIKVHGQNCFISSFTHIIIARARYGQFMVYQFLVVGRADAFIRRGMGSAFFRVYIYRKTYGGEYG